MLLVPAGMFIVMSILFRVYNPRQQATPVKAMTSVMAPVMSSRPPRHYLTPQIEQYMARDKCTVTKQRCRGDNVCEICMVCPDSYGRKLLGWAATKCKSPTDCVQLETNVDWTREKVDPGWCEQ